MREVDGRDIFLLATRTADSGRIIVNGFHLAQNRGLLFLTKKLCTRVTELTLTLTQWSIWLIGWAVDRGDEKVHWNIQMTFWHMQPVDYFAPMSNVAILDSLRNSLVDLSSFIYHVGFFIHVEYNQMGWSTSGFLTKWYWTKTMTNAKSVGSTTRNVSSHAVILEAVGSSFVARRTETMCIALGPFVAFLGIKNVMY